MTPPCPCGDLYNVVVGLSCTVLVLIGVIALLMFPHARLHAAKRRLDSQDKQGEDVFPALAQKQETWDGPGAGCSQYEAYGNGDLPPSPLER